MAGRLGSIGQTCPYAQKLSIAFASILARSYRSSQGRPSTATLLAHGTLGPAKRCSCVFQTKSGASNVQPMDDSGRRRFASRCRRDSTGRRCTERAKTEGRRKGRLCDIRCPQRKTWHNDRPSGSGRASGSSRRKSRPEREPQLAASCLRRDQELNQSKASAQSVSSHTFLVFVSERGPPFSTAGFARMIERAAAAAGLELKAFTGSGQVAELKAAGCDKVTGRRLAGQAATAHSLPRPCSYSVAGGRSQRLSDGAHRSRRQKLPARRPRTESSRIASSGGSRPGSSRMRSWSSSRWRYAGPNPALPPHTGSVQLQRRASQQGTEVLLRYGAGKFDSLRTTTARNRRRPPPQESVLKLSTRLAFAWVAILWAGAMSSTASLPPLLSAADANGVTSERSSISVEITNSIGRPSPASAEVREARVREFLQWRDRIVSNSRRKPS
jgi:hypothetical protein